LLAEGGQLDDPAGYVKRSNELMLALAQSTLEVTVTDSGISLSSASVRPGPVTFVFRNEASTGYEMEVEGPGVDDARPGLEAGKALSVTLTLREGKYEVEAEAEDDSAREWKAPPTVGSCPSARDLQRDAPGAARSCFRSCRDVIAARDERQRYGD